MRGEFHSHDRFTRIFIVIIAHLLAASYGISQLKSPTHQSATNESSRTTYTDLQHMAHSILNVTPDRIDGTLLLQQIEDFCGKLDRLVEEEKDERNDLQKRVRHTHKFPISGSTLSSSVVDNYYL